MHTWRTIFYIFCGLVGWLLASVANAFIDREPPIKYVDFYAANPIVASGDKLTVLASALRSRNCPNQGGQKTIVGIDGLNYDKTAEVTGGLCPDRPPEEIYDRIVTIPEEIPPGPAVYYVSITYTCHWIQKLFYPILVESPRATFTIISKRENQ